MKKLIYCAAALAAMIFAGSCQQENLEPVAQESTVTFSVELPGVQTKAIGDGFNVDQLVYEVWKTEGDSVRDLRDVNKATRLYQKTTKLERIDDEQKTIITLNLVHDQNYTILFWAQNSQAVDVDGKKVPAYVTDDLTNVRYAKEVTAEKSYLSNNENMAAFYKAEFLTAEEIERPNGIRRTELKRPFAQLNIGTKNTAEEYFVTMNNSKVKITSVPTTFNVAQNVAANSKTGTAASPAVDNPSEFVFDYDTVPEKTESLWVNGDEYEYVAMNYIFANGNVEVEYWIDATLTATAPTAGRNETTNAIIHNKVPQVPLMENYRTNIVGNLLTSTTKYEVVIDADFETPKNAPEKIVVLTAEELQNVLDNAVVGDNAIYLGNDIVGDVMLHQKSGVHIVLYGQDRLYEGTIKIHNGSSYNDGTFKVQDVNFHTSTVSHNFIMPNEFGVENGVTRRYSNNVTVENCTFTAEGDAINTVVGIQAKSCTDLQVIGCTATGLHSLLQAQSCGGDVIVSGATINGKNGVAFKQVKNAVVYNATITAAAYGIRFDGNTDNYGVTIEDCNVTAVQPVIVRKMTGANNTIAFKGTNTLETEETFQVVITNGSDDEAYSYPTGTYTLTGNEGLNVYPIVNAAAFAAALTNDKLAEVTLDTPITSVGKGFEISRDVVLNMENKEVNAGSDANSRDYALEIYGKNNVEVNGANFTRAGISAGEGANVVFNSGIINHKPERSSRYIFYAAGESTTITINDGTFNNDRPNNSYFWADGGAVIYVKGGNFGGVASTKKVVTTNDGQVIITGGTFNFDPSAWVKPGFEAVKNGSVWTIKTADPNSYVDKADGTAAAYSQAGLTAAIEAGELEIALTAGTYSLSTVPAGLKLVGLEDDVVLDMKDKTPAVNGEISIENVTIEFSNENYKGFQHTSTEYYKNCTIIGQPFLYGNNVTFDNCTFKQTSPDSYNVWTYGAKNVNFNECEFYSAGKSVLVYNETNTLESTVTFEGCKLDASTPVDGKAAVEIDASLVTKYIVKINDTEAINFAAGSVSKSTLWNIKKGAEKAEVYVNNSRMIADGVVLNPYGEYELNADNGLFWFADQVNVAKNNFSGKTVKLAADIDLKNAAWTPVGQTGATTFNGVFDGQNYTISNLNVNSEDQTGANYSSGLFGWVESHTAGHGHIKNVKIEGATITGHHNCGALVGYITQETALVENCHVTGATINCTKANADADGDKAGALIGNATVATPVKDCTAASSTVSAGRDAGQVIGAGKEANVTGCSATEVAVSANGTSTGKNVRNEVIGRLLN